MSILKKRLLIVINEDWFYWSHYRSWALRALKSGYEVHVALRVNKLEKEILADGTILHPLKSMQREKISFSRQLLVISELYHLYREIRPDVIHHLTFNAVLCGSIAAKFAGRKNIVNAVTGLGHLFIQSDLKTQVMRNIAVVTLRCFLPRKSTKYIIANPDDKKELLNRRAIFQDQIVMVPGSGVDPNVYPFLEEPDGDIVIMLASRMLWPKGIQTFVDSAKMLKEQNVECRMVLVGDPDPANPTSVPLEKLKKWDAEGIVEWWGHSNNILDSFSKAHIVCLPSFREGLPRVLIEAASCGKPVVTSDVPGCREICRNGENGFLFELNNALELTNTLGKMIEDKDLRAKFGKKGRSMVKNEFSLEKVTSIALDTYSSLLRNSKK